MRSGSFKTSLSCGFCLINSLICGLLSIMFLKTSGVMTACIMGEFISSASCSGSVVVVLVGSSSDEGGGGVELPFKVVLGVVEELLTAVVVAALLTAALLTEALLALPLTKCRVES